MMGYSTPIMVDVSNDDAQSLGEYISGEIHADVEVYPGKQPLYY